MNLLPAEAHQWDCADLRRAVEVARIALWTWNVDDDGLTMDEHGFELWGLPWKDRVTFKSCPPTYIRKIETEFALRSPPLAASQAATKQTSASGGERETADCLSRGLRLMEPMLGQISDRNVNRNEPSTKKE